jgi:ketosteroid isomerase-like protein
MSGHHRRISTRHRSSHRGDDARARIDAYFDREMKPAQIDVLLDDVVRDPSVLDDLAGEREWIDALRQCPRAPDLTTAIMRRAGLDPSRFDRRHYRRRLWLRRSALSAVILLAATMVVWMRFTGTPTAAPALPSAAPHIEAVFEALPAEIDPLQQVRVLVLRAMDEVLPGVQRQAPRATGGAAAGVSEQPAGSATLRTSPPPWNPAAHWERAHEDPPDVEQW